MGDECAKEKRYKPVTHVIFDMDGLLLDTETVYEQVFQKIADQYGKHYTHDIKQKVMGRGELDAATLAVSEMELPITVEDFLKQYHPMCKEALTRPSLMPGVPTFPGKPAWTCMSGTLGYGPTTEFVKSSWCRL